LTDPLGLSNTVFNMSNPGLFNGNIAAMMTEHKGGHFGANNDVSIYGYKYDQLHRIKNANQYRLVSGTYYPTGRHHTAYMYDADGNLTSLSRNDMGGDVMDDLTYSYNITGRPNQLGLVTDAATQTGTGQFQGNEGYVYDPIGN